MKRSPLKRNKPLKRGTKGLKKSRLAPVSPKRKSWLKQYQEQHAKDPEMVVDAMDGRPRPKSRMTRHHVARRLGNRILIYVYITAGHHDWIERHAEQARKLGWLRNEGEGYPKDPKQPRPWFPGSCINEHLLD
jgi:hypothetical protein